MSNQPTMEQWRRLHELANRIKTLKPWTFLEEDDVFGVRDPSSGEDGFVSVMGRYGEHFAIALYLGAESLANFWEMQSSGIAVSPAILLATRQLLLSFDDRDALDKEDRAIIKAIGAKYRGRQAWPLFRSFVPGYLPWKLEADEADVLIHALEQTLDVVGRAAVDDELLSPPDNDDFYLIRIPSVQDRTITWSDQMTKVLPPEPRELNVPIDLDMVESVRKLPKKKTTVEIDSVLFPQPVVSDTGRPYLPTMLLLVDDVTGMVLANEFLPPQKDMMDTLAQIPQMLLVQIKLWGTIPGTVMVSNQLLESLLTLMKDATGWKVKVQDELVMLNAARSAMFQALGFGDFLDQLAQLAKDEDEDDGELLALLAKTIGEDNAIEDRTVRHRGAAAGPTKAAAKSKAAPPKQVYQLKITLNGSKPPIWRRVLVPDNLTLNQLHHVIQVAMGWYDAHLHEFTINNVSYGIPDANYLGETFDEHDFRLSQVITPNTKRFRYTYDFGDDWEHIIVVEKVLPYASDGIYPLCLTGKRACPPEDVGGIWGYQDFLEMISDPSNPDYEELLGWNGGPFDPEEFDIDEVNQIFAQMRGSKR